MIFKEKSLHLSPIFPILNGQYQAVWNANQKFWQGTSAKNYKLQLPFSLFPFLHQFLYQQISFSQLSRISFKIISKRFYPKFLFFNGFTLSSQPHPLNGQNLLNVTKSFCWFSPKYLLKYFFFSKNLLKKSCKTLFKGFNYRFFGLLFKT